MINLTLERKLREEYELNTSTSTMTFEEFLLSKISELTEFNRKCLKDIANQDIILRSYGESN